MKMMLQWEMEKWRWDVWDGQQRKAAVEAGDAEGVLKGAKAGALQSFNWEHVQTELDNSDSWEIEILHDFSWFFIDVQTTFLLEGHY